MSGITADEAQQIERANESGSTPVVFIHGLWILASSWANWADLFERAGYAPVTPVWPDDPETVAEARSNPDALAGKTLGQVADHTADVIGRLDKKPAVMGHSTGGLLTYMMADRGLSAVSVAIDPGPFRGVLPLPIPALRSAAPVLTNPLNRSRAVTLTLDQFKYGWANALDDDEAKRAVRDLPRGRARSRPDADGQREPQPLHRGEGGPEEPRPRPAADHQRREGPHGPVGDRQRRLQAPEARTRP